jgi:hypothetical protein
MGTIEFETVLNESRKKRHFLATQSCLTRSMLTFCFGTDETRVCAIC